MSYGNTIRSIAAREARVDGEELLALLSGEHSSINRGNLWKARALDQPG